MKRACRRQRGSPRGLDSEAPSDSGAGPAVREREQLLQRTWEYADPQYYLRSREPATLPAAKAASSLRFVVFLIRTHGASAQGQRFSPARRL